MLTDKQANYLKSLLKDYPHELNRDIEQLTKQEASVLIGFLVKKSQDLTPEVEPFFKKEETDSDPLFPIDDNESLPF